MTEVLRRARTPSRRRFLASCMAAGAAFPALEACSTGELPLYEDAVAEMRRPIAPAGTRELARLRDLVRQATLAASSHNTQPWRFALAERSITILPDLTRRTPAVDPDDHHLFVSLGCATENLVHAAQAAGLHADVRTQAASIDVAFDDTTPVRSALFEAIPVRQCSRSIYDGHPLTAKELRALEDVAQGDGVHPIVLTATPQIETVLDYVTRGNTAQIGDPAFVEELKAWIRFNEAEAVRTGDGLFSRATGNPAVPRWLGSWLLGVLLTPKSENEKCAKQLRSSAGVVVFVSDASDQQHWIEVGRSYERFALQATALGIRTAFLNQPVEVASLRSQFATWLNLRDRRPDLIVRFGRGPEMARSLRRPLDQVLVSTPQRDQGDQPGEVSSQRSGHLSVRSRRAHLASFVFLVVLLGTGIVLTVKAFGSDSRSGRAFGPARPFGNARAHRRQRRSHGQRFALSTMIQLDRRHCHLA